MVCRKSTIEAVLHSCVTEKSPYQIAKSTGLSYMAVLRALRELEEHGLIEQVNAVGVYPKWVRV
jgi:predicted ArsR family transcriptional regulator